MAETWLLLHPPMIESCLGATQSGAACLLFGPKKVLVVAGKNKIVRNLEEGMNRIREYVAPVHAKRRDWDLPCTKAGKCVDCKDPERICNRIGILKYERDKERTTVILVGEDLGI